MNKKQYFMLWWGLCSIGPLLRTIFVLNGLLPFSVYLPLFFVAIGELISIIGVGITLAFGLDFTQKIGMRLYLWQENFDAKNDIFKPALIASCIYSIALLSNLIFPTILTAMNAEALKVFIIQSIPNVFFSINYSVAFLLFYLSGLVLLIIKSIGNKALYSLIPLALFLTFVLQIIGTVNTVLVGDLISTFIFQLIMVVLFWKKGFETAVVFNIIASLVAYILLPFLLLLKSSM